MTVEKGREDTTSPLKKRRDKTRHDETRETDRRTQRDIERDVFSVFTKIQIIILQSKILQEFLIGSWVVVEAVFLYGKSGTNLTHRIYSFPQSLGGGLKKQRYS
jgi:hypothetical protein